jgi:hypothetical protein
MQSVFQDYKKQCSFDRIHGLAEFPVGLRGNSESSTVVIGTLASLRDFRALEREHDLQIDTAVCRLRIEHAAGQRG